MSENLITITLRTGTNYGKGELTEFNSQLLDFLGEFDEDVNPESVNVEYTDADDIERIQAQREREVTVRTISQATITIQATLHDGLNVELGGVEVNAPFDGE